MATQEKFKCTIKRMFNGCPKSSGWFGCFAHIRADDSDIKLTGMTSINLVRGMQLDVTAEYNSSDDSYKATEISVITKTRTGLISYLASLPNINRYTAETIVDTYGNDAIATIKSEPNMIKAMIGLSDIQMQSLMNGINNASRQNTLQSFLPEFSPKMIKRISETLKKTTATKIISDIKQNPYMLVDIPGITFPTADAIALRLGFDPLSPFRVNHGLIHTLKSHIGNNLYVNLYDNKEFLTLMANVEYTLKIRFKDAKDFSDRLLALNLIKDSPIIIEPYNHEYHLYLSDVHQNMTMVAYAVSQLCHETSIFDGHAKLVKQAITAYECDYSIKHGALILTDEQNKAVTESMLNRIHIISGGPGRGKTTIVDCLAYAWMHTARSAHDVRNVILLAPTGKAMNKLKNSTKMGEYTASTIDRLTVNANDRKKFDTLSEYNNCQTLIIIDESSMIDIEKAAALFDLLPNSQYCFIGDIDQLPPIGIGAVLKDMIASNKVSISYLTKPLRNSGLILENADKINAGNINLKYNFDSMPFYPQLEDNQTALDFILEQYNDERAACPDITQLALLSPMKKGLLGVANLNMELQNIACPLTTGGMPTYNAARNKNIISAKGYEIKDTIYGNENKYTRFRIGDVVINTKNMYNVTTYTFENNDYWNGKAKDFGAGLFNGDCGRIIGYIQSDLINENHEMIVVQLFDNRFVEIDYTLGEFDSFDLGYAMTVHKSQGCEYDTVIYISPKQLLNSIEIGFANKNLVYTAVTRSKQKCVIIGSKESLNACITHNIKAINSNLAARIS